MRKFLSKSPLWLSATVLLFSLCTSVVIATSEYIRHMEYSFLLEMVEKNKQQVLETVASSAVESVITEDIAILEGMVSELAKNNSDIALLRIRNEDNLTLAVWGTDPEHESIEFHEHSEPIQVHGEIFGHVDLIWNLETRITRIEEHVANIYQFNSLSLFIFTLLCIFGFRRLVGVPLQRIESRVIDYANGKDFTGECPRSSREFSKLSDAIDQLEKITISRDRLEEEIRQRQRVQEQLAIARDEALRATRAKSAFLANMSHEIRTPLTAIIGFSENLLETNQSMSDRLEAIQTVIRSGKHLQSLINDILDLSKIEAEKLEVEKVECHLYELIHDVFALASLQAEDKGLYCNLDVQFPIPEIIVTDPLRLKQILINLCGNAIKFTDQGGIKTIISYSVERNLIQVHVEDTGLGMDPLQMEGLFTPFTRLETTTRNKVNGTGLGLYLSQQLAHMMGGEISAESVVNAGSRFTLTLNAGEPSSRTLINQAPDRDHSLTTNSTIRLSGTVLLAEDNPDNQRLISYLLRKMGVDCDIADNGEIAVDMALKKEYDLILMDMQMPILDGLAAVRRLREGNYPGQIIMLTANATVEVKEACLKAGCNDFLTKPVERNYFRQTLINFLYPDNNTEPSSGYSDESLVSTLLKNEPSMRALVLKYVGELPILVEELRDAYEEKNWELLRFRLHDLKTTSGNYGFPTLSTLAAQTEFITLSRNIEKIEELLAQIEGLQLKITLSSQCDQSDLANQSMHQMHAHNQKRANE